MAALRFNPSLIHAWFEDTLPYPLIVSTPPKGKKKDESVSELNSDQDLEDVLTAENPSKEVAMSESTDNTLALIESARIVIKTSMDIRRGENVLIVCDPTTSEIGQALHSATTERTDRVLLIVMPKGRHHGEEPPAPVANLMRQQQVVIAPTKYSLTHTRSVRAAISEGARVATMPGITSEMFCKGGMTADYDRVKKRITDTAGMFRRRRTIHIKSKNGTDVEFEVSWRDWKLDDSGICNRPRMITNLPAGKIFVMPKEGTMNGRIVIDGSWDATLLEEPIEFVIENGLVIDVLGGSIAANIRQEFGEASSRIKNKKDRELVWTVAEFGMGMNEEARLIGNVLEDEKKLGTCYFALGDNSNLGGHSDVGIHVSGVLKQASVWLDDNQILDDGNFIIE
ncbi:MAG: aminopeptidase [Candidatus Poseidoniales archaeon]